MNVSSDCSRDKPYRLAQACPAGRDLLIPF
jgi:hypothetical protein